MLICPECGNTCFNGISTKGVFRCPAAGCGGVIDPAHPPVVIRDEKKIPHPANDFWNQAESNPRSRRNRMTADGTRQNS